LEGQEFKGIVKKHIYGELGKVQHDEQQHC